MATGQQIEQLPMTGLFSSADRSKVSTEKLVHQSENFDWEEVTKDSFIQNTPTAVNRNKGLPIRDRSWYAYAVLALMLFTNGVHQMGSQILIFLWTFIVKDIPFSYAEYGMLIGYGFTLSYVVAVSIYGFFADRISRKYILLFGISLWIVFDVAQGLAHSYVALLLFRIGMGAGHAACTPMAYSILGQYFSIEGLALADSIYSSGTFLASGLASLAPNIATKHGWRVVFFGLAIFDGAAFVLVFFLLFERKTSGLPAIPIHPSIRKLSTSTEGQALEAGNRRESVKSDIPDSVASISEPRQEKPSSSDSHTDANRESTTDDTLDTRGGRTESYTLRECLRYYISLHSSWIIVFSIGFRCLAGSIFMGYMPAFLMSSFPSYQLAAVNAFGIVAFFAGITSCFAGGAISRAWSRRSRKALVYVPALGQLMTCPFVLLALYAQDMVTSELGGLALTLAFLGLMMLFAEVWIGPTAAYVQSLTPIGMESIGVALYLGTTGFITGSGPEIVGMILQRGNGTADMRALSHQKLALGLPVTIALCLSSVGLYACSKVYAIDTNRKKIVDTTGVVAPVKRWIKVAYLMIVISLIAMAGLVIGFSLS